MVFLKKIIFLILITNLLTTPINSACYALNIPKEKEKTIQKDFFGKWNMQTIVIKSNCPYVIVGSTTESNLEIKPPLTQKKDKLKVLWKGGKWTSSIGLIKLLSKKEAITERVTEMKTRDNNYWKAILIDHIYLDENGTMHSESIVSQYKNGDFVGEYKTFSILTKEE